MQSAHVCENHSVSAHFKWGAVPEEQRRIFTSLNCPSVASHCTRLVLEYAGKSLGDTFFKVFVNTTTYVT